MAFSNFYHCEKCGNVVALINQADGVLTCCDQPMTKLTANTVDAAHEKHVPVIRAEDGKLKVTVGSVPHPMLPEHFIEWIALVTADQVEIRFLKPGDKPEAEFTGENAGTAYGYCNLHGLWEAELLYEIPNESACSAEFPEGCIFV